MLPEAVLGSAKIMIHNEHTVSRAIFVDEVDVEVRAGDGGNGCMSFRREKFVPKGGPNGGDGGNGGSVIFRADESLNTLHHLVGHHLYKARRGAHGLGKNCHGKSGDNLYIDVPPGTLVYDAEHDFLLFDLTYNTQEVVIAKGGRGGRGNARFATPENQAPREFEMGTPGEHRKLRLELKLMADVGLVGLPNAGKSTLLSRLSSARPKIGAYPFTTLKPSLGLVELAGFRRFVMADIPGLIEGAHEGAGLGDEFLRHIERTAIILHMVDLYPVDETDPVEDFFIINRELAAYSRKLAEKPQIVVVNKMDLAPENDDRLAVFSRAVGQEVLAISAVTGQGLDALCEKIWNKLHPEPGE